MKARTLLAAGLALHALAAGAARAQDAPGAAGHGAEKPAEDSAFTVVARHSNRKDDYKVDYAVPVAPAYTILGAAPSGELTAYFGGNVQYDMIGNQDAPAAGVTLRPYWLTKSGKDLDLDHYQLQGGSQWWLRRKAATVLSVAGGITGEGDKKGAAFALGLHTELTSNGDPRLDPVYIGCAHGVAEATRLKPTPAGPAPGGPLGGPDAYAALAEDRSGDALDAKLRAVCLQVARVRYANRNEWLVGVGAAARSPDQKFSNVQYGGVHWWTSYRHPLNRQADGCNAPNATVTDPASLLKVAKQDRCAPPFGQLVLFGRYIQDDKITVAKDTQEASDTYVLGASFKKDAVDGKWGVGLSAAYNSRDWHNPAWSTEQFWRYSASASYRIASGTFLSLEGGTVTGDPRGEDDFALVRLNIQQGPD